MSEHKEENKFKETPKKEPRRLGWKRGLPRLKQFYMEPRFSIVALPPVVDLEPKCPPIYDQQDLGACTSMAAGALSQFQAKKTGHKWYMPSRLAIYYWTREMEGSVNDDTGATLHDTMQVLVRKGVPHEDLWWYNIEKFAVKPSQKVVTDAGNFRVAKQLAVNQNLHDLRSCIAEGDPFIFGFSVYESFLSNEVARTGVTPMPHTGEEVLGGHAVMAVGYDDRKGMFKVRNSWGKEWGQNGYFWMPYDYVTNFNLSDDFWTLSNFSVWKEEEPKKVEEEPKKVEEKVKK
jgi:C1A family cysteine protease